MFTKAYDQRARLSSKYCVYVISMIGGSRQIHFDGLVDGTYSEYTTNTIPPKTDVT
jgi:hypothetical protein